ncbi:MAG TPA: 23S rRNA (adenine(2503)-C(2))-methyltransferase RlmN, partial [Paludibacteraceae bacterium]|nr:23S rRNA (adenine(2503)-C(2))-methyltransferase RlmN [Paludibacteraceae bacterium]
MQNTVLLGKNLNELKDVAKTLGMPTFTGKQLAEWLYKKRAVSFDEMSNISLKNRQILAEHFTIGRTPPIKEAVSIDGTKKYLFQTAKGTVESVFIPEDDRATLCISSQVGCKMNCLFCMTGKQGFSGNLTASEILNQILSVPDSEKLTNLVYMGMGEPMDNTLEVLRSLNVMTSEWGLAWSPRR